MSQGDSQAGFWPCELNPSVSVFVNPADEENPFENIRVEKCPDLARFM